MSDLASRPNTPRTLWITDRRATMAATPTAMQMKKNSSRRHDERVSRTAIRRTNIMRPPARRACVIRASAMRRELRIVGDQHQRRVSRPR